MVNVDTIIRKLPDNTDIGDLTITNGTITNNSRFIEIKTSGHNGSNAIVLTSNSGTNETIELHNIKGNLNHALHFVSNAGGVCM